MPVRIDIEKVGTFKKLRDRTVEVGRQPNLLNEDPRLYGKLEEGDKLDLTLGCEGFKDEGYADLYYSLFDYIKKTSRQGTSLNEVIGAEFVSTRRNLITFAKSAYPGKRFEIRALRKNGVIFLCDRTAEVDAPGKNYDGYGYKFELYMSLNDNEEPHDDYEPPSNAECIKSVLRISFKSGSEEIKVFYAAEVDARNRNRQLVEFKTTRLGYTKWLESLSLGHYLQSFLGGVSYIIKGTKDQDNFVYRVDKVNVNQIPKKKVSWNPQVCLQKLFEILREVKTQLRTDDEAMIIRMDGGNVYYEPEEPNNCNFVDPDFLRYFE